MLYSTRTTNSSFTVTNYTTYKFPMPLNSGARFYTTNGAAFYAVGCNDTGSSTPGNNQNYDWGYALLPAAALTPVVIVGWAPGSDVTSPPANGSPVWVTPTKATTIYVNYSGNYNSGPFIIAPNGHHYDTNYCAGGLPVPDDLQPHHQEHDRRAHLHGGRHHLRRSLG